MKITEELCVRIRQRYLLVLMSMIGLMLTTLNSLTFSLLLGKLMYKKRDRRWDEIVCPPVVTLDHHPTGYEEFDWGKEMQLYIIAAWSVGYVMGRFPSGLLANKLGGKSLYGYSVFITGVCALLTPLCARSSPYIIMANRVCSGIFASALYPCLAWFAAHWFPRREMGFMISLTLAGFPLGCMVTFPFSHKMYKICNKWASVYYAMGGMTTVWAYLWQAYIWDDPFIHPYISRGELEFLTDEIYMYAYDTELQPGWKWPWKSILTSRALFTLAVAEIGYSWIRNFATIVLPNLYFPDIHNHDFINNQTLGMLVYAMMALALLAAGVTRDKLISNRRFNATNIIKTYYGTGCVLSSICLLFLIYSKCNLTTVFIWYIAAMIFIGIGYSAWIDACVALAPNFAPTNIAITGVFGNVGMPLQVLIESHLSSNGSLEDWKLLTYINAAFALFPMVVFLKYGTCNIQRWNAPIQKTWHAIDYEKPEGEKSKKPGTNQDLGDVKEAEKPVQEMQKRNDNLATPSSQTRTVEIQARRSSELINKSEIQI
uniref:Major facilitator superfamily (MFS) profile domain-containing protein n=1 Tax=Cuerna arida TaxID=1464854 RepID=A0A1B6FJ74_9HEMI